MACLLYRLIQHQDKPQTVRRGTTELARTLLPPSENPHFMRVSGITCQLVRVTTVKLKPSAPSKKDDPVNDRCFNACSAIFPMFKFFSRTFAPFSSRR